MNAYFYEVVDLAAGGPVAAATVPFILKIMAESKILAEDCLAKHHGLEILRLVNESEIVVGTSIKEFECWSPMGVLCG
jgi:hypothetical protein